MFFRMVWVVFESFDFREEVLKDEYGKVFLLF